MTLWSTRFRTGWMLVGRTEMGCACGGCSCKATAVTANVAVAALKPVDFISAEALGTETLAHCAACRTASSGQTSLRELQGEQGV
jgi:hypothetical protein